MTLYIYYYSKQIYIYICKRYVVINNAINVRLCKMFGVEDIKLDETL